MKRHTFLSPSTAPSASLPTQPAMVGLLSLGLAGLLLLGGCNKHEANPEATPATTAQTAPAPPEAPAPTTAPAPAPAPVPAPAPAAAPAPAPVAPAAVAQTPPPPPPPRQYTIPAGTPLVVRLEQAISAKTNNVGDSFSGVLAQSVTIHGARVLPAGAPVTGTVVAAKGQGRFKGAGDLGIAVRRVGEYSVTTSAYEKSANGKGKRSAAMIGGGGGGGALIGGLAGGGKGALIGGLLGAGAGTAGALFTGNKDVTIPAETVITFTLSAPLTVTEKSRQ